MRFIDNQGITDPTVNLAIEEYVLRHLPMEDDSYLLFYINKPSIIIGKHQNTIEEINADYVKEQDIQIVRRLSGGGAVYHDLGNLNFSFLTKDDGQSFNNFKKFTEPVVAALHKLGVHCELTGRNDIQVGEQKISGNAQFSTRGRMFSHGTLLFNSEMDHVASALKVNAEKIASKSTKSVRSRVANITDFLAEPITILQFREEILRSIFGLEADEVPQYHLTEEDWKKIYEIAEERYRQWDWNYGESPKFNIRNSKRFPVGIIDLRLDVVDGMIENVKVYGDFFAKTDIAEFEALLRGTRYEESAVRSKLADTDLTQFFGMLTLDELIRLLFLAE